VLNEGEWRNWLKATTHICHAMWTECIAAFCWARETEQFHVQISLPHLTACQVCDSVRIREHLTKSRLCVPRINILSIARLRSCFVSFRPILNFFLWNLSHSPKRRCGVWCLCPSQKYRHKLATPEVCSLFCDASVATAYDTLCCAMFSCAM
jgi:hypothetical protein